MYSQAYNLSFVNEEKTLKVNHINNVVSRKLDVSDYHGFSKNLNQFWIRGRAQQMKK